MKKEILYIEHKTDQSDRGEAWIGEVEYSKSGKTIYFNGLAFKKMTGTAYAYSQYTNYYDLENREGYWISGVKKNGQDRHYLGGGKIMIDRKIVQQYLQLIGSNRLDENRYEIVDVLPTDKQKFEVLENEKLY